MVNQCKVKIRGFCAGFLANRPLRPRRRCFAQECIQPLGCSGANAYAKHLSDVGCNFSRPGGHPVAARLPFCRCYHTWCARSDKRAQPVGGLASLCVFHWALRFIGLRRVKAQQPRGDLFGAAFMNVCGWLATPSAPPEHYCTPWCTVLTTSLMIRPITAQSARENVSGDRMSIMPARMRSVAGIDGAGA